MTEGDGVSPSAAHPSDPCAPDMTEGDGVSSSAAHPSDPCAPDMSEGDGVSSSAAHPSDPCAPDMTERAGVSLSAAHPSDSCGPDMTERAGVSSSAAHHSDPCAPDMTERAGVSLSAANPSDSCGPDMTERAGVSSSAAHHSDPCAPDMTERAGVSSSAAHHSDPCAPDMTERAGVSSSSAHPTRTQPCTTAPSLSSAYAASTSHNVCHTTNQSGTLMYGGGRHNNPFIDNEAQDEEGHVSQESHDYYNYRDSPCDMDNFIDDTESHDSQEHRPYYDCHDDGYVQKKCQKEKARLRQYRASMTSPQRSQIRQVDSNKKSQARANMTTSELARIKQKERSRLSQTRASMTTPERTAEKERNRSREKTRRAQMTDEQKKLEKEKRRTRISLNKARNSSSQKLCSPVLLRQDSRSNMSGYKTPPAPTSSAIHHHNYSRSPASSLKTAYSPHDISFHTVNVARNNKILSPLTGYGTSTQSQPKLHSTPPHHSQHCSRSSPLRHSRAQVSTETNIDIACTAKSLLRSSSPVPTRPQTTLDWDFVRFPHGSKLLAEIELHCANKCTFCPGFMENCPFTHLKSVSPNQHFTPLSKASAYQSPPIESSSLHNSPVEDQPEVPPRPISTLDWDFVRFPHGSKLLAEIELDCANKCTFCPGFMENCPFTHFQSVSQDQHFTHSSEPSACQSPP